MKRAILLIFIISFQNNARACIWQNNSRPFWPSTNIEVCFLPADADDLQNLTLFNEARGHITQAYRNFGRQSDFDFHGFSECNDMENPNRDAKIRIDLTTSQINGEADSIGPESARDARNLSLSYLTTPSKDSNDLVLRNPLNIKLLTFHETMHLLGFHHDCERSDAKNINRLTDSGALVLGNFDPESVTYISSEAANRMTQNEPVSDIEPRLSVEDRRCLRILADRTINSSVVNTTANPSLSTPVIAIPQPANTVPRIDNNTSDILLDHNQSGAQ